MGRSTGSTDRPSTAESGGRRAELVDGALGHVLRHGLSGLALRPLAAELGTSDRMLIYYFGTREALVVALLRRATERLRELLAKALPAGRTAPADLLAQALGTLAGDEGARPLLRLWIEVVALAGRGDQACAATAAQVLADWLGWLEERLDVAPDRRRAVAAGLLAVVDGLVVLDLIDPQPAVEAGTWLLATLAQTPPAP